MFYVYSYARPDRYAARKESLGEAKKTAKLMQKARGGHFYIEERRIVFTTKTIASELAPQPQPEPA